MNNYLNHWKVDIDILMNNVKELGIIKLKKNNGSIVFEPCFEIWRQKKYKMARIIYRVKVYDSNDKFKYKYCINQTINGEISTEIFISNFSKNESIRMQKYVFNEFQKLFEELNIICIKEEDKNIYCINKITK